MAKTNETGLLLYYDYLDSILLDFTPTEIGEVVLAVYKYALLGEKTEFNERCLNIAFKRMVADHSKRVDKDAYLSTVRRDAAAARWEKEKNANACNSMQMHANADFAYQREEKTKEEKIKIREENTPNNVTPEALPSAPAPSPLFKEYGFFKNVYLTDEQYNELCMKLVDPDGRIEKYSRLANDNPNKYPQKAFDKIMSFAISDNSKEHTLKNEDEIAKEQAQKIKDETQTLSLNENDYNELFSLIKDDLKDSIILVQNHYNKKIIVSDNPTTNGLYEEIKNAFNNYL